jgi:hypothetical protein
MPRISYFHGISIKMYWDEGDHPVPHFHAEYAGEYASIAIDGTVLGGSVPPRTLKLIQDWIQLHQQELTANWERARSHEPLARIDPLP